MDRKQSILHAIIKEFIETAEPVGSQTVVLSYNFSLSSATIRNEMANLEEEGLITQPYTSAGRIPTDRGYRLYVDELADYEIAEKQAKKTLQRVIADHELKKAKEKIYDAVAILAEATENVSFSTLPDNQRTFYLGISNVLRQPEFSHYPVRAQQVVEALENNDNFVRVLRTLNIDDSIKIFIGKENILTQIQSCAMMVTAYRIGNFEGFLGLLGPTRMKYPFNHAILKNVKELLET